MVDGKGNPGSVNHSPKTINRLPKTVNHIPKTLKPFPATPGKPVNYFHTMPLN